MVAEDQEHIQVSQELAELGNPIACWDKLELAAGPCRKKFGEEERGQGLAWACCGMKGWRESMEDAPLLMPFGYMGGEWRDAALFGVLDGHGGEQVARFAARRLPAALAELPAHDPEGALASAFLHIDNLLREPSVAAELAELTLPGNEIRDSADRCGTTAVCCLVRGSELIVANAGDSRAVLSRRGKAVMLTEDHKPELPREKARIEAAGGFVQEEALSRGGTGYRVNGDLNLSRALGDLHFKDPSKPAEEHMVSGVPDTKTLTWKAGEDEFVLLACDGIWECMGSQEAVNFVRARLPPAGTKRRLGPILEALCEACCANHPMQRGGLGCDNLTAVLVRFEDPLEVAATAAAGEEEELEERASEGTPRGRQLEAALSQTIQRLSSRQRLRETPEEKREREAQEKEAQEEQARSEREEAERRELRKRRREEREALEKKDKRRVLCCAAVEDEDEADEDEL